MLAARAGACALASLALVCPSSAAADSVTARADALVKRMTLGEEAALVGSGTAGVPRLGVPALEFTDGPNGVGEGARNVTSFPNAVAIAAAWDPALARAYGRALGAEAAAAGKTLIGAPTINILRSPGWGRAAETLGEDPFLTARLVAPEIQGIQGEGVIAEVKHYAANNQEVGRFGKVLPDPGVDVRVDERTLREIYQPGFRAAVGPGGAASVMCSYNRVNGTQACQSPGLLGDLRSFGLRGFVEPDAQLAVRDVLAAFRAGVGNFQLSSLQGTLAGQPQGRYEAGFLLDAVNKGTIGRAELDRAARDILVAFDRVGLLGKPTPRPHGTPSTPAHRALATEIATRATVLLRNRRGVLPLSRADRSIAVIGADAGPTTQFQEGGSPAVLPGRPVVTPLAGLRARAPRGTRLTYVAGTRGVVALPRIPPSALSPVSGSGRGLTATYYPGADFSGAPVTKVVAAPDFKTVTRAPLEKIPGTQASSVRYAGTLTAPRSGIYRFSIATAGRATLRLGGRTVVSADNEFIDGGQGFPGAPPVSQHGEMRLRAGQRVGLALEYSTAVSISGATLHLGWEPPTTAIQRAAAAARRARVAVVFANDNTSEGMDRETLALPGDQDRLIAAVARANRNTVVVLNTSGPVLMPWRDRVASIVAAWYPGQMSGTAIARTLFGDADPSGHLPQTWPASDAQGPASRTPIYDTVRYSEGLEVGYRWFGAHRRRPLYPFGFGLSYTTFRLGSPRVVRRPGGAFRVSVPVRNTGKRAGAQVVQAYVSFPAGTGEPPRRLEGFARVALGAGGRGTAVMTLNRSAFQIWSTRAHAWTVPAGRFGIAVGTSSRDLLPAVSVRP